MVYPVFETNTVLKSDCARKVSMSCGFIFKQNYVASYTGDIVCGKNGTWDQPVDIPCTG